MKASLRSDGLDRFCAEKPRAATAVPLVLSIFPGIDLLGRGFEAEGFCVVRGPDPIFGGDVRDFHPPAGHFSGVVGGPPCQDFSRKRRDPPTGNGLAMLGEFRRVVIEAQPAWWLMENVVGVPDMEIPGYKVQKFGLNARECGLRQNRPRVFQFGYRDAAGVTNPGPVTGAPTRESVTDRGPATPGATRCAVTLIALLALVGCRAPGTRLEPPQPPLPARMVAPSLQSLPTPTPAPLTVLPAPGPLRLLHPLPGYRAWSPALRKTITTTNTGLFAVDWVAPEPGGAWLLQSSPDLSTWSEGILVGDRWQGIFPFRDQIQFFKVTPE